MPKAFQSKTISQDRSEQATTNTDVSEMETVYKSLEKVEKPALESFFSRSLTSSALGLLAGIVGSLLILGDLFGIATRLLGQGALQSVGSGRTVVLERKERIDVPWEEVQTRVYEDIRVQMYPLYKKKKIHSNDDVLSTVYISDESNGSSVGLTSDGWFVTVANAMKDPKSQYVVSIGGKVMDMETVVRDPASDLVFFRVKAESIVPTRFFSKTVVPGLLTVVARARGVELEGVLAGISSTNTRNTTIKNPFETSERLSSFFIIDSKTLLTPGVGAFSLNGELFGLYDGSFGFIPVSRLAASFPMVLKQKIVPVTVLGVTVLDLSSVSLGSGSTPLLFFGYRVQSIQSASPAQKAKLQVGDVIVSIEQERVGSSKSLFERIQEYPPETSVTLEVLRGSDTIKVPVVLGAGK